MALLEATDLGISFGGLRAVDELNMQIEKGALVGLIGPNGAGKTTVFNMLRRISSHRRRNPPGWGEYCGPEAS